MALEIDESDLSAVDLEQRHRDDGQQMATDCFFHR